jgi:DNA-binding transcriptional LysR family regulator
MDMRQLQHFIAVAEEQNFTRAAQRVHVVQSALSSSIRSLEEELGTSLFHRNPRHVSLTTTGEIMLGKARSIVQTLRAAREAVAEVEGVLTGTLSICSGLLQYLNPYLDLVSLLARFRQDHPGVDICFRQLPTEPALDQLRHGDAEIAFIIIPDPVPDGLDARVLGTDRLAFVCPQEHPFARRGTVAAAELAGQAFIELNPGWRIRSLARGYLTLARVEHRVTCEVNEVSTLLDLVDQGFGVALLPRRIAGRQGEARAIVELSPPGTVFDWGAAVLLDRTRGEPVLSAAARAFMALLSSDLSPPARSARPGRRSGDDRRQRRSDGA